MARAISHPTCIPVQPPTPHPSPRLPLSSAFRILSPKSICPPLALSFSPFHRLAVKCLKIEVGDFCSYLSQPCRKELATHTHTRGALFKALGFRSVWFRSPVFNAFSIFPSISFSFHPSISDSHTYTHKCTYREQTVNRKNAAARLLCSVRSERAKSR